MGTQGPFDRLVAAADAWAQRHPGEEVVMQIGEGASEPRHARWMASLRPDEFRGLIEGARVVVSHAGMGTILTSLEFGKPVLVMPRRAALGEHRNDHQVDTAHKFAEMGRIRVADDAAALAACLEALSGAGSSAVIAAVASASLLDRIREFIHQRG